VIVSSADRVPGVPADPRAPGLAVVSLARGVPAGVAPEAMAAALQAARDSRDVILLDLPAALDEAALLALTCADRSYIVVAAEVRACAAASRAVATVRRHCPDLELVVRSAGPRGLRPVEVAQALGVRLAGVIPLESPLVRAVRDPGAEGGPLARLSRTLLTRADAVGVGGASR
jgi:septum formation inhibitor-activating ATPase MinD